MAKGKIVQIIGTVIDVEFPPTNYPKTFNALEVNTGKDNWFLRCRQISAITGCAVFR